MVNVALRRDFGGRESERRLRAGTVGSFLRQKVQAGAVDPWSKTVGVIYICHNSQLQLPSTHHPSCELKDGGHAPGRGIWDMGIVDAGIAREKRQLTTFRIRNSTSEP